MASAVNDVDDICFIDEEPHDDNNETKDKSAQNGTVGNRHPVKNSSKENAKDNKPLETIGNQTNKDYNNLLEKLKEKDKRSQDREMQNRKECNNRKSNNQNEVKQEVPLSKKSTKDDSKNITEKNPKPDSNEKENIPKTIDKVDGNFVRRSIDRIENRLQASGQPTEDSGRSNPGFSENSISSEYEEKGAKPKAARQNDLSSALEKHSNEASTSPISKDTMRRKSADMRKGLISPSKQYNTADYKCIPIEGDIKEIVEDGEGVDEDSDIKIVVTEAEYTKKKRPCPKCVAAELLNDQNRDRKRFYSRSEGCSPTGIYMDGRRESEKNDKNISYARKFESDSKIKSDKSSTLSFGFDKESLDNATDESSDTPTVNELLLKQQLHRKRKIKPFKELVKLKRGNFHVGIEGDRKASQAKTIVIMPDKKLVIFDKNNKCLKLFDPDFNPLDKVNVPTKYCGLAAISEVKFIASLPQIKKLHIYEVDEHTNKIKMDAVHPVDGEFYSISHYKYKLYMVQKLKNEDRWAEDEWKIVALDLKKDDAELEELRSFTPGHQDFTLCANEEGVYMTNKLEGEVLLLWHDGTYKEKYKVQLSLPVGITYDGMGNIYISGGSVTSFIEICKPDLHGSKIIYNKTASDPVAMEYDKHDNMLYVCDRVHGTVMKYKIEHRGIIQGLMSSFVRGEHI